MKPLRTYLVMGAIFVAVMARIPGVFWGYNFPTGWRSHHIDEYAHLQNAKLLIEPSWAQWTHPYPKGLAAHVAVPALVFRAIQGELNGEVPSEISVIVAGRVASVLYGSATVVLVFWLAKRLFRDERIALAAAWIMALGGLHVSQSHFFLADVPSLFWALLGTYLLLLEFERPNRNHSAVLLLAGLSFGIAMGIKLAIFGIPSLLLVAAFFRPRIIRLFQSGISLISGFLLVNVASYTPYDLIETLKSGVSNPYEISWWSKLALYALELPSVISLPITLLLIAGFYLLLKSRPAISDWKAYLHVYVIVILPLVVLGLLTLMTLSQFPRHLVPYIPWISMLAAWSLVRLTQWMRTVGVHAAWATAPLLLYLTAFVFDGERVFLQDPRNQAAEWIMETLPVGSQIYWRTPERLEDYKYVHFPEMGRPPVLVIQMMYANFYLSGSGLRDGYPSDYRTVFDGESQARVEGLQAVFSGDSEYEEIIRFDEGYVMPEYILVDRLIGDRARNHVSEIVVFVKDGAVDTARQ